MNNVEKISKELKKILKENAPVLFDTVYETATEEEEEMNRLTYLVGSIIGLKSRLNRVCNKI
ncbi:hypothetical protein LCGC14_0524300 [marine sediment metagenome]|uniref:Uncharacterized protein n=1 Tax=marine sediment metagenome TaxID=412755 RepID=A0A0F9S276_9ZZZZ